ncbi:MAG: hypothetical protein AB9869_17675 [Verrucomicrobiia bacterium]
MLCPHRFPRPDAERLEDAHRSSDVHSANQTNRSLRRFQILFLGTGLLSLLWFLVRVVPKPSRAAYPCQRAAAPMASACVLWILSVVGSTALWRRSREFRRRFQHWRAWACAAAAAVAAAVAIVNLPETPARAGAPTSHGPIGTAQGIHPGRVVWVHAPDATDWSGRY